jgi:hypothetical protein
MNDYLRKVEAERIVLRTINRQCGDNSLHGLSAGAIATWVQKAQRPTKMIAEVSELSQMIGAMCERSGERDSSTDRQRFKRVAHAVRQFAARYQA